MANTSALQVSFEPTVVTSLSGVTLRSAPLAAPVLSNLQLDVTESGVSATINTDQETGTIYYSVATVAAQFDLIGSGFQTAAADPATLDGFNSGLNADQDYYFHYLQVNDEGTQSTYQVQAFRTSAPNVVSTTTVEVTFAQAGTTIVPIVDADTSSQSVLGLGSGNVSENDLMLWHTVSGDSSNLTINPNGTWQFSTAPTEDVVIGLMVYSQQNATTGAAGQIVFDTNGVAHVLENVILRPAGLTLASSPVQIVHGEQVSFTFDDVSGSASYGNTRIFLGGITGIEIPSFSVRNDYGNRYTFTFSVPTDAVMRYGNKSVFFVVGGQTYTSAAIPFLPQAGSYYVGVVNPDLTEQWSAFDGYTGDDPETGGQLVWTINSIQSGLTSGYLANGALQVSVIGGGEVVLTENISIDVYYISRNDQKGDTATKTYLADAIPPTVTLIGDSVITLSQGQSYTDEGANVTDNIDPSTVIYADIFPDMSFSGQYILRYTYTDAANNTTQATRTINVIDTVPPVLTLVGDASVQHERGQAYVDQGANAIDAYDGVVTPLVSGNTVNINQNGTYSYTYTATDSSNNSSSVTRTVTVVDPQATQAPTLVHGDTVITLNVGDLYQNPEWTAYDDLGSLNVDWTTESVNTAAAGTYYRTASAVNGVGSVSQTLTIRIVEPVAIVVPVITPTTATAVTAQLGDAYSDPAWTAADNLGDVPVVWTGAAVDTATANVYTRIATASNAVGSATPISYRITVLEEVDTIPPEISLIGANPVTVTLGVIYNDAGATANDLADGNLTSRIQTSSNVNSFAEGSYTVTYSCTDDAGNTATATRTVNVVEQLDTEPPVIVLIGSSVVYVDVNSAYLELGAVASDTADGDVTNRLAITNNVETSKAGVYVVRYNASDSAGNQAVEVTRTVIVRNPSDDTIPVIVLLGDDPYELPLGAQYVEPGFIATDNLDGNITANVTTETNLNVNQVGNYTITYTVRDSSNNQAIPVTRNIVIYDDTKPEIRLIGASVLYVDVNTSFTDSGAMVRSGVDGEQTITSPNSVDVSTVGTYTLEYNYTDSESVVADTVYRTVIVRDPSSVVIDYRDSAKSIIKPLIKRIIN